MREEYDSAMTRRGNVAAVAVGVAVLMSACSSDDAAPTATEAEVAVDVGTTSPATSTETSATPTTPTTPSTEAPTTSLDPATALAADVEADLLEAFRLGREASMDPFNADKEAAAMDRRLGVIAENFAATLADYRARNYAIRPNSKVPAVGDRSRRPGVSRRSTARSPKSRSARSIPGSWSRWELVRTEVTPSSTRTWSRPGRSLFLRNIDGVWRFEGGRPDRRLGWRRGMPARFLVLRVARVGCWLAGNGSQAPATTRTPRVCQTQSRVTR